MSNLRVSFPELVSRKAHVHRQARLSAARSLDRCISSGVGYNEQITSVATDSVGFVDLLLSISIKSCRRAYGRVTTRSGSDFLALTTAQLMAQPMECVV